MWRRNPATAGRTRISLNHAVLRQFCRTAAIYQRVSLWTP